MVQMAGGPCTREETGMKALSQNQLKCQIARAFGLEFEKVDNEFMGRLKTVLESVGIRMFTVYWTHAEPNHPTYGPHLVLRAGVRDDVQERSTRRIRLGPKLEILENGEIETKASPSQYQGTKKGWDPRWDVNEENE